VLLFAYQFYLNANKDSGLDPFLNYCQSGKCCTKCLGYSTLYNDVERAGMVLCKKQYVTRMVEGCNAISVMILFVSLFLLL
jgi:hypothetical protein